MANLVLTGSFSPARAIALVRVLFLSAHDSRRPRGSHQHAVIFTTISYVNSNLAALALFVLAALAFFVSAEGAEFQRNKSC